jgi:hypothetical protein
MKIALRKRQKNFAVVASNSMPNRKKGKAQQFIADDFFSMRDFDTNVVRFWRGFLYNRPRVLLYNACGRTEINTD